MRKNIFYVSIAIMSIFATDVMADDVVCNHPLTLHNVVGSIDTINVGQSVQVGTIHLQLISEKKGKVVFEEDGGIIGRVTSINTGVYPIESTLNHHIVFADGSTIETNGDQAEMYPTSTCSFSVTETISNLWGTKQFKRASGVITANGTVSFCEGANGNHFDLEGTVCLK
jgi:hypothetical protein